MPPAPVYTPRLRCDLCGWNLEVTADELLEFSSGVYPQCCNRVLSLEVDGLFVRPSERTKVERVTG
jgi:hypothetical protein